jgi:hypothetical protein
MDDPTRCRDSRNGTGNLVFGDELGHASVNTRKTSSVERHLTGIDHRCGQNRADRENRKVKNADSANATVK